MMRLQLLLRIRETSSRISKPFLVPASFSCPVSPYSVEKKPDLNYDGSNLPSSIKVVICGGGVMGAAVAYHLAELGWGSNTVLIEQGRVGGGTTWHSSGLVGVFKPSLAQVKLCQSSVDLYQHLENQGHPTGWKKTGSLCVARTWDRMIAFRRMKAQSVAWNIECELVTPSDIKTICPLLHTDDLKGGLWIPNDGVADPYQLCLTLLDLAKDKGEHWVGIQKKL
ncbi:hypothetical protein M8J76_014603 [Diaphorina citri]|nr:hypothetical protein M8J76_014603 [Diaphorina citri]